MERLVTGRRPNKCETCIKGHYEYLYNAPGGPWSVIFFDNEVLASEICRRLNIPHVEYKIVEQNHKYYSACKDFADSNTEFVSALYVYNSLPGLGKTEQI